MSQIQKNKLPLDVLAALDSISLGSQGTAHCMQCSRTMVNIDATLSVYGADQHWTLKLPMCAVCDSETIQ